MARGGEGRLTVPSAAARVAAYYAPEPDDPLRAAGNAWLGRDPETGAPVPQPALPGIADLTADARAYGFHATLKPPMRLRPGTTWEEVRDAAEGVAASVPPFDLPPLAIAAVHGFLALRETAPCPPLGAFADACVAGLDRFREPPAPDELARRRRGGLTPEQDAMLTRWGYPYVFDTWFFHMTLTRRLAKDETAVWLRATEAHFAGLLDGPRRVGSLCLFTQAALGKPFVLAERLALQG